jgi:hypothetical protein
VRLDTDEQRALVNWSLLYDNVYQHPECPADAVVEDDDLLDGWLIDQRRDREAKATGGGGRVQLVGNEKIRGSQEVYLVAETPADARKVVDLNDEFGRAVQKQRFAHLRRRARSTSSTCPTPSSGCGPEVTAQARGDAVGARPGTR